MIPKHQHTVRRLIGLKPDDEIPQAVERIYDRVQLMLSRLEDKQDLADQVLAMGIAMSDVNIGRDPKDKPGPLSIPVIDTADTSQDPDPTFWRGVDPGTQVLVTLGRKEYRGMYVNMGQDKRVLVKFADDAVVRHVRAVHVQLYSKAVA